MSAHVTDARPRRLLGTLDAIAIITGLVIGAGIFRLPSLVATNSSSETAFYLYWLAGGAVSIVGALCYCELATTYPSAGGDYHFLTRAFGRRMAFLFAWARIAVITSGSIAILGYTFGDYASNLLRLGPNSSALWAALATLALTGINLAGLRETKNTQSLLTLLEVLGVIAVIVTGAILLAPPAASPAPAPAGGQAAVPWTVGAPMAMLFVLFTFGGWNEGAYLSAELKHRRSILVAMIASLLAVTVLYLAVNYAYVRSLGLQGLAGSTTAAADVLQRQFGDAGGKLISLIIAISSLTSINATVLVGARSNYALGRDWRAFRWLGHWDERRDAPRNALIVQGVVALVLVVAGAFTDRIETMVNYTMPVFWFFFMMVGIGLFVLRRRDPRTPRPFRVPLYPVTPLIFIATCAYLLYSSLAYVGNGAWFGAGVLAVGAALLAFDRGRPGPSGSA
ncbi:MAG: amino acid permease [Burkholderiaceae bacterium]